LVALGRAKSRRRVIAEWLTPGRRQPTMMMRCWQHLPMIGQRSNAMSIPIASVPQYFQPILNRIGDVLDADIEVESSEDEWLNFTVDGYSDQEAMRELEKNKLRVLLGTDSHNFRILCPWNPSAGDGLWLHSLQNSDSPDDYLRGNWYY
jgi:hypothetical protein